MEYQMISHLFVRKKITYLCIEVEELLGATVLEGLLENTTLCQQHWAGSVQVSCRGTNLTCTAANWVNMWLTMLRPSAHCRRIVSSGTHSIC